MRNIWIILVFLAALSLTAEVQDSLSFGFGLSDSAGNFGLNLELNSPRFLNGKMRITGESQYEMLSAYRDVPSIAWEPFSSHRLGINMGNTGLKGTMFLYGEFGGLAVIPPEKLSDDAIQLGIYGLFGFEFPIDNAPVSYYLEAGSNGFFDKADKLIGNPDFYGGFTTKTGIRFYY